MERRTYGLMNRHGYAVSVSISFVNDYPILIEEYEDGGYYSVRKSYWKDYLDQIGYVWHPHDEDLNSIIEEFRGLGEVIPEWIYDQA